PFARPARSLENLPPLGLPAAGAAVGGRTAAPGAGAALRGQAPGALGGLFAAADCDANAPARIDPSADIDAGLAAIVDGPVLDRDAVTVGGVAAAGFGDHQHAPVSVKSGPRPRTLREQGCAQRDGSECRKVRISVHFSVPRADQGSGG